MLNKNKNKNICSLILVFTLLAGSGSLSAHAETESNPTATEETFSMAPENPVEADLSEVVLSTLSPIQGQPDSIPGAFNDSVVATPSSRPEHVAIVIRDDNPPTPPLEGSNPNYCEGVFYPEDRTDLQSIYTVDAGFVKTIFNMKEVVYPMTKRKAAYWCGFAAVAGTIAALESTVGFSQYIVDAVQANSTAAAVILYATEPLFALFDLAAAKYPEAAPIPNPTDRTETVGDIALVIPAHNSSAIIRKTIQAALKHLNPEQIFVVDNGNTKGPTDDTREKLKSIDPKINYIWQGIPNKTIAQYAGAMAASKLGYKYIMTTDDDVRLPENFDFCTREINEDVKAVCFPVRAVSASEEPSIMVNWQDIEYQAADLGKMVENRFCGAQYPHGAGSLFETETFLDILKNHHDTIFHAEDMKLGYGLAEIGKKMVMCSTVVLDTDAPTSILGKKPNFWQQRARCWEMTRHIMLGKSLKKLLMPSKTDNKSWPATLVQKKSQLTLVASTLADWVRLPVTLIMMTNLNNWAKIGVINGISVVAPLILNYGGHLDRRPDLKVDLKGILTYPVYKMIYAGVSTAGALRAAFIYLPNYKDVPTINEMEKNQDRRCVWLKDSSTKPAQQ